MRRAQHDAGLPGPEAVDAVIAHATATPAGDLAEARAINDVFGEHAAELPVTSIKGHVGHTGSASGVMGLLAGLHGMQAGTLVQVAGTTEVSRWPASGSSLTRPPRPTSTCCRSTGSASAGRTPA